MLPSPSYQIQYNINTFRLLAQRVLRTLHARTLDYGLRVDELL